jgi:multisubunit Na+/H+ antiporter MnhF subunit
MNVWEIVAAVLGGGLVACGGVCLIAGIGDALIALEIAGVLTTTILMLLSEGLQRQPFVDLAVVAALLSLVAALVIVRLLEDQD